MKFPVAPPSLMMGVDFLDLSELDDDDKTRPLNQNDPSRPFPEVAEEELEWLSNIDAFPEVETCGHMLADPGAVFWAHQDHQSPVSVLESNTSSANSGNNSTITTYCGALKIPVSFPSHARSKRRRRRRKVFTELPVEQGWWWNQVNVKKVSPKVASGTAIGRKCLHCLAEETPQWRAGPMGPKTLCNACGVRYKSGRLVPEYRPASSPTFSSKLHSNSHRTIMEKRRQSQMGENRKLEGKSVDYSSTTCGPQVNIKNVNQNLKLEGKSVNYSSTLCGQQINIKSVDQNREGKRAYDSSTPTCGQQVNIKNVDGNLEGKSIDDSSTPGGQQLNINNVDHNLQGRSVDYSSTPCSQQVHSENLKQNLEEKMVDNSYNPTCGPQLKINNVDHSLEGKSVNDSSTTCVQQVNIKYANQENPKPKVGSGTAFSRRCQNCLAEETLQWHGVPMGTLCSDCWMRYKSGQLVPTVSSGATSGRRCQHCLAEISPKCRMGPMGKTLCNACGMRYTLGRLLPRYPQANRPTYSSTLGVQIKNENHERKEKSVDGSSTCGPQVEIKNMKQNLEGKSLDHSSTRGQQVNIKNLPKKNEKIKNQKNPEPFLPSPAVSCGARSGSRCQHCLTENTPNWRVGPMGSLCDACWLKYKSSQLVAEYHPASSPPDRSGAASGKRCQHCSTKKTPQWRTGHMGMTLCNACGMRYKLGRLVPEYRPAETFSRKLHSNSHKKTTVMKRQSHVGEMMVKKEEPTDIEEDKGGLVML